MMGIFGDKTIFKRSEKGQVINKKSAPQWNKLKFNNKEVDLSRDIIIGRDKECDISFPTDSMVSREHCKIEMIKGTLYLRDLGSTNGTFVNKNPVKKNKSVKLKPGDILAIGSQRLKIG